MRKTQNKQRERRPKRSQAKVSVYFVLWPPWSDKMLKSQRSMRGRDKKGQDRPYAHTHTTHIPHEARNTMREEKNGVRPWQNWSRGGCSCLTDAVRGKCCAHGQCKGCVEISDGFAQEYKVIEIVRRIEKGSIEIVFLFTPSRASSIIQWRSVGTENTFILDMKPSEHLH
jgi:hypothetical protein